MGHYDEFYEAEAERAHAKQLKNDEEPLRGRVESVEFNTDHEAAVVVRVSYYGRPRMNRLVALVGESQTLAERVTP